jgi:hypothetical protein
MSYHNSCKQCRYSKKVFLCDKTEVNGRDQVNYSSQVSPSHAISPSTMELNKEQQVF